MKYFKLPFTVIIATLAIALTFSANAGMLKNSILAPEDFCYTNVSSRLTCTSPTVSLATLNCPEATVYFQKPVYGISIVGRIPLDNIETMCPGGNTFCCAEIEAITTAICPGQPTFNIDFTGNKYYKITAIHCKF